MAGNLFFVAIGQRMKGSSHLEAEGLDKAATGHGLACVA
jgi:hypothetical protein